MEIIANDIENILSAWVRKSALEDVREFASNAKKKDAFDQGCLSYMSTCRVVKQRSPIHPPGYDFLIALREPYLDIFNTDF